MSACSVGENRYLVTEAMPKIGISRGVHGDDIDVEAGVRGCRRSCLRLSIALTMYEKAYKDSKRLVSLLMWCITLYASLPLRKPGFCSTARVSITSALQFGSSPRTSEVFSCVPAH